VGRDFNVIPTRYLFVVWTFCLSVLLYVDRICVSTAKNEIATDLSLDDRQMGWVLSVFALGYAVFQTPGGWLADRVGPRRTLSIIVLIWSTFTGLTAAAFNFLSMLIVRFLFGAGEAGAFPGIARATFSWIPMKERGVVQGINFSGSRIGGAVSLATLPAMIEAFGWRRSFVVLMAVGFVWAILWHWWFRDDPSQHRGIDADELAHILAGRQQRSDNMPVGATYQAHQLRPSRIAASANMWLLSLQYLCSNFTFFFCLTWLFPHMQKTYQLSGIEAGLYSAAPLACGAIGNWVSGWLVDAMYRRDQWVWSRRAPAMLGFALAAIGLLASFTTNTPWSAIAWFSLAVFGADMTLAPSWSVCIDIGRTHSGVVSGTMNMAGNLGSFLTALAFPYLAAWTRGNDPFFYTAASLNMIAVACWLFVDPRTTLEEQL
jgi:ACS family glucarate transporter-like MFS transporter